MIEEIDNKNKYPFIKVLFILFILFFIIYMSKENGLYEYKVYNKTRLTEESIKSFEKDINEGKNVMLKDYIINDNIDYSNTFSKTGRSIGRFIEKFMNDGIKKTLKVLSALFYE